MKLERSGVRVSQPQPHHFLKDGPADNADIEILDNSNDQHKSKNKNLVWSATGSDSDWGNASIGTTAQDLLSEMMLY